MVEMYPPTEGMVVVALSGCKYTLSQKVGDGGLGIVFKGVPDDCSSGSDAVAIKFPNVNVEEFSQDAVDARIGLTLASFRSEVEMSEKLKDITGVIRSIDAGMCYLQTIKERVVLVPFLVQEFVHGAKTLQEWCDGLYPHQNSFSGIQDPVLWYRIVDKLLHIVQSMHQRRIVHRDIWPPNILMSLSGDLSLIDYGMAFSTAIDGRKQPYSSRAWPYLAPECHTSCRDCRTVDAAADMYSVGGILFFLATGRDPSAVENVNGCHALKSKTALKKELRTILRDSNPGLSQEFGVLETIMLCLRPKADERKTARQTLRLMSQFRENRPSRQHSAPRCQSQAVFEVLRQAHDNGPIFEAILNEMASDFVAEVEQFSTPLVEITGTRDTLINKMLAAVAAMPPGGIVKGLTSHLFWARQNFGPDGRLLSMFKQSLKRGVNIDWCLLVPESRTRKKLAESHQNGEIDEIISAQKMVRREVAEIDCGQFSLNIRSVPDEQISRLWMDKTAFVSLRDNTRETLIVPDYFGGKNSITTLRMWQNPSFSVLHHEAFKMFSKSGVKLRN